MASAAPTSRHIAIDLGASTGRLIEVTLQNGKLHLEQRARFQSPQFEAGGYLCWDIDRIHQNIVEGLAKCAASGPITSVGVDTWGVDFVLLDGDRRRVGQAVTYRDHRTDNWEKFFSRVPRAEVYHRTGIQFMCFNSLYQLAALAEREPTWLAEARHLLFVPDYLHFRLSGRMANEYTIASTSQALGLAGGWDPVLLRAAGVSTSLFAELVPAGTRLGTMSLGTGEAAVIAPGSHDTASAVAATPLEGLDEAYISSGTWSLMGIESMTPIATEAALQMNFTNEGGLERRFRVLKNLMGLWPIQRIAQEHGVTDFGRLAQEAASYPAWRSIVNPDDPLFLNPTSMTDALHADCRRHSQPVPGSVAQLARCVFDSLALAYRHVKEQLESLSGRPLARIRIVGGGCQNLFLNQLCADACQIPVVAGPVEASAIGNALAQKIALGELENLDAARALVRASFNLQEFRPAQPVPEPVYQAFQQMLLTRF